MHNDHFSRHAQQVLTVAPGRDPSSDPSIARSWLRCLEDYHTHELLEAVPCGILPSLAYFRYPTHAKRAVDNLS